MGTNELTRPVLRWFGGKWRLAPWIISHFPPHKTYIEPFGGAASVLLRKPRSYSEVYNDLDGEVVNLFRVLRSDSADDLIYSLALTPFARDEFVAAYEKTDDPLERARRLIVRSYMGFGSGLGVAFQNTGFRNDSRRSGSTPAQDWMNYPDALRLIVERLRGVVIENKDAWSVMEQHDREEALHYIDPPYMHETRSKKNSDGTIHHGYVCEMSNRDHEQLLSRLDSLQGAVMVSGYDCELYNDSLSHWHRRERKTLADKAQKRTEVLWMNFDPSAAPPPGGLF